MIEDPRIRTVLKRYPKNSAYCDASIDLDGVPVHEIMSSLRLNKNNRDAKPQLLDDEAISHFSNRWPQAFDKSKYDYFIHRYLKEEYDPIQNLDIPYPRESGPPDSIPRPDGQHWVSVRPSEEGYENWEAWEEDKSNA